MTRILKTWLSKILTPLAIIIQKLQLPWQRLWAHSCLAAKIKTPLDPSVVIYGCPEVHGTGNISLGKNLHLYRELYLETQEQGYISLGNEVVLSRGVHIVAFASIKIGAGSMIGEYTSLRDANHRFGAGNSIRYSGHTHAPIVIGANVWIGRGVTILAGVNIGDNAVIGANAVVTKDVTPNTLAAGIPARFIKQY